jgi:hypothetical protein
MTQLNKYILIPPGGPAGPFWGVMRQSGLVVATQIAERDHAQLLVTIGNISAGDFDTVRAVGRRFAEIWSHNPDPGAEDYIVRSVIEAIADHVAELTNLRQE